MAYAQKLAERIRMPLEALPLIEKKMFGGVRYLRLLKKPHAKRFDITGKPMKGWLLVEAAGYKTEKQLNAWVKEGVEFTSTLPSK